MPDSRLSFYGPAPLRSPPTEDQARALAEPYQALNGGPIELPRSGTYKVADLAPEGTTGFLVWLPLAGAVMVAGKSYPTSCRVLKFRPRIVSACMGDKLDVSVPLSPEQPGLAWPLRWLTSTPRP